MKINGTPVEVSSEMTLLQAAKTVNVNIPTLCYHPDLPAWAACGICVVKLENSPKMVRACATPVAEGMSIITHDPELHQIRKTVLELILSTHPTPASPAAGTGPVSFRGLQASSVFASSPMRSDSKTCQG